jgi:hypothetical protein
MNRSCRLPATAFALAAALAGGVGGRAAEQPANLLWDAGFDTGFGTGFWTAVNGNRGPSRRDAWVDGAVRLVVPIGSRAYPLVDGDYALCAWVRAESAAAEPQKVRLTLTNGNYYRDTQVDSHSRAFEVPAGAGWHRVGWTFTVAGPVRPLHHVEVHGGPDVLVDAVTLTTGTALPDRPCFAAALEAGFDVAEETRTYLDGEPRRADLVIVNHGPAVRGRVTWELFDHREDSVERGAVVEGFAAGSVTRRPMPLDRLPHGGYRLASSVEGGPVLGDALVALLPRVDAGQFPVLGLEASLQKAAIPYTPRLLNRLGVREANLLSCSGNFARWGIVEAEEGRFAWQDFMAEAALGAGLEMVPYLSMTYELAPWVTARCLVPGKNQRAGLALADEQAFSAAYCRYVDAFVRRYAPRGIRWFMIEDEVHAKFPPGNMDQFVRLYEAAYDTAKRAAAAEGVEVRVGVNATTPEWWDAFLARVPHAKVDLVSSNTAHRPGAAVAVLEVARKHGVVPGIYHTAGVGQKSPPRRTSLLSDRHGGAAPLGTFAWQALLHAWLSRPYGTENPADGPVCHTGFYDQRTLVQCAYLPFAGKTGVEFDNSPSVGWQSLTMLKSQLGGMRPVRDARAAYSIRGLPTATEWLHAYPFRDGAQAIVYLAPTEEGLLDRPCRLSGFDFGALPAADLYGRPLARDADGTLVARELPVHVRVPAARLDEALAAARSLAAAPVPAASSFRLEAGDYALDFDLGSEGWLRLWRGRGPDRVLLVDRLLHSGTLPPPRVTVDEGRLASRINVSFGKEAALGIEVAATGCTFSWIFNNSRPRPVDHLLRLRVAAGGAGRRLVVQDGSGIRAGRLREDYGSLTPDAAPEPARLAPGAARVALDGFLESDLPAADGRGFTPASGFLWKTEDGQAFLEARHALEPYAGGGSRGVKKVMLEAVVR